MISNWWNTGFYRSGRLSQPNQIQPWFQYWLRRKCRIVFQLQQAFRWSHPLHHRSRLFKKSKNWAFIIGRRAWVSSLRISHLMNEILCVYKDFLFEIDVNRHDFSDLCGFPGFLGFSLSPQKTKKFNLRTINNSFWISTECFLNILLIKLSIWVSKVCTTAHFSKNPLLYLRSRFSQNMMIFNE